MTLYTNFIITSFIIFYSHTILSLRNSHLVIEKAGLDTVFPSATGLVFVAAVNNTSDDDFEVELTADKCCLAIGEEVNCEFLEVIGACAERISRGTVKIMKLVAPILDPFERVGHCIFYLDSKSVSRRKKTMRNKVKIDFDTRLQNKDQSMVIPRNVRNCNEIDEDPFNNCELVDCDSHYNGKRSNSNRKMRKCMEIPECLSDSHVLAVYDPTSNKCMEDMLKKEDFEFVKQLLQGKGRNPKDILIIKGANSPNSQPSYDVFETNERKKVVTSLNPALDNTHHYKKNNKNSNKISELITLKPNDEEKSMANDMIMALASTTSKNKEDRAHEPEPTLVFRCFNCMFKSCTLNVLGIIVIIQCCCIFTMICFLPKSCTCTRKKFVNKFFNYRQDASMTTPLIDTSNIDTETTNYSSESNVDRKIKCYKACQRDAEIKISLSDDILSKCVTRRDWHSKPDKYMPQTKKTNSDICKIQEKPENEEEIITEEKVPETKVNFQDELTETREKEKKSALYKSIIQKLEAESDSEEKMPKCDSSETEIQSHFYTDEKPKCDKAESVKNCEIYNAEENRKQTYSISTEKAAQAEFSNDSIDDFLSERGIIYLAGENLSKYSQYSSSHLKNTSSSVMRSSLSSGSSKTSKNNIVKNMLSIFRRNSKSGPSSEPGAKKSVVNMELLHMSHASLYSSSNNGSQYFRCLKKGKDSRTSL